MKYVTSDKVRWIAIAGVLLYAILRTIFVWATLEDYGVNPWIFLAIDASTAITYVLGIEHLLRGLSGKSKSSQFRIFAWGVVAVISFAAPYVYMYWAGQQMPVALAVGIGLVIILLLLNAVFGLRRRIQLKK